MYQLYWEELYQNLPFIIIIGFTVIPLVIGSLASQNSVATVSDYFLCNRSLDTTITFFTVYATWWSSFAFLGSTSYFYSVGSVYWTGIAWNVLFGLLFMLFGVKISRYGKAKGYLTPISFFSDIYQSKALNQIVMWIMILFTIPYIQIQFYGGALIIEIASKGIIPWQLCALIFYLVMIIYLWAGGLRAVAWTDIFYGILIFFGMLAGGAILVGKADGIENIFSTIIEQRPDLILLSNHSDSMGVSAWLSMFVIMPIGALMGPQMWIRMYAIKEEKTFYLMPFLISLATIAYLGSMMAGSAATLLKSGVTSSDSILPILLLEFAPGWVMALIMCCGAAACLSTANSCIHAVSALLTLDLYKQQVRRKSTEKHLVMVAKITIVAFSAVAYLSLILSESPGSIVQTGYLALSGLAQLAVPVAGALVWERSHATGAIAGILTGITLTMVFTFMESISLPLHPGLIGLIMNAFVFLFSGVLFPPNKVTSAKILLYQRGSFEEIE